MALAVGEEIHRLFESWDFAADRERELEHRRAQALLALEPKLTDGDLEAAQERLGSLLERLAAGSLLERFCALGPNVLGREVPIAVTAAESDRPVGLVAGVVDLIYQDVETGSPVIVDFKTDRVETDEEIAQRVEAYSAQEEIYRRAIRDALGLASLPAFELWFLWPDRLWRAP